MVEHNEREIVIKRIEAAIAAEVQGNDTIEISELPGEIEELIWKAITIFQKETFHTIKGLEFAYIVKGNEIFVDRKDKSITRATVCVAASTAIMMRRLGEKVSGPKKLRTFGASYLYPIFNRIGIV